MEKYTLECCIDTTEAAITAKKGGATRFELCGNLVIGGTTPSEFLFKQVREQANLPIHTMIRPRFGDFCYSDFEFEIMLNEIKKFRKLGSDGVVFGVVTPNGGLDINRMKILCDAAGNMNKILHRAFDITKDPFKSLNDAKNLGINTILTSGQKANALAGKELIKELVKKSGDVEILLGSGVNAEAIKTLLPFTGSHSYHMSGRVIEDSPMVYRKQGVPMGLNEISEFQRYSCSWESVNEAKEIIESLLS